MSFLHFGKQYETHQAMVADIRLMCNNARHYNEEGSGVYNDAVCLERVVKKKLKSLGPYTTKEAVPSAPNSQCTPNATWVNRRGSAGTTQQLLSSGVAGQTLLAASPGTEVPGSPNANMIVSQQQTHQSIQQMHQAHAQQQQQQRQQHQQQQAQAHAQLQQQLLQQQQQQQAHAQQQAALQQHAQLPLLQRLMLELFQTVREYCVDGRLLSAPFMRLPTRAELPSYYEFIKRPVEMQQVARLLVQSGYSNLGVGFDEFCADLFLMFDNACKFNEPDSQIYKDALTLHRVALAKRRTLLMSASGQPAGLSPLPPSSPPDITTGLRRLLTSLHNAMLTACDTDGRGLVDSLIAGDGTEASRTSSTAARLAGLHRAVAAGAYRRLDRLQADWLGVLRRARVGEPCNWASKGDDSEEKYKHKRKVSEVGAKANLDASTDEGSLSSPAAGSTEIEAETESLRRRWHQQQAPTRQQRADAAELARRWVRLRDELCRRQKLPEAEAGVGQVEP
ncbi:unnamed protein product [Protopolystoma xenopodis]|uniref:Bromo domain-containing protein n=1 Tax=Protopolystoma xenopodis TaxID=117903 RepID=A0A3S5AF94_9PLAT|nr:unnamed protein product [Protopolystoma xenopodis]